MIHYKDKKGNIHCIESESLEYLLPDGCEKIDSAEYIAELKKKEDKKNKDLSDLEKENKEKKHKKIDDAFEGATTIPKIRAALINYLKENI